MGRLPERDGMSRFDRRRFLRATAAAAGTATAPLGAAAEDVANWEWTDGGSRFGTVNGAVAVGDGVVLAGTVAAEDEPSAGFAARLAAGGNVVWRRRYVSADQREALEADVLGPIPQDGVSAVLPAPDGDGALLVGWTYHDSVAVYVGRLVRIASDGRVQWERSAGEFAPDLAYSYLASGAATGDGYLLCGMGSPGIMLGGAGWLVSLGAGGRVRWQRLYPATDRNVERTSLQDVFRGVVAVEGGYVVGGYYDPREPGDPRGWVLGVDPAGGVRWEDRFGDGPAQICGLAASDAEAYDLLAVGAVGTEVDPGDRQFARPHEAGTEGDGFVAAYTAGGDRVWRERLPGTPLLAAGHGPEGILAGGARRGRGWAGTVDRTVVESGGPGLVATLADAGGGRVLAAGRRRRAVRTDAWARAVP